MKKTSIIILAAGKGSRMKSNLPKVMHKVAGREMINMVIDEAQKLDTQKITLVVSDEMKNFYEHILKSHSLKNIEFTLQKRSQRHWPRCDVRFRATQNGKA